jgi:hypothetical protein
MRRLSLVLGFVFAAGLVAACGQTKMLKTWKSPEYEKGTLRRSLVIGVFSKPGVRETVEGQFVQQLKEESLDAVPSHSYLQDEELNREAAVQKVAELGFDGVVLARILDQQTYEKFYASSTDKVDVPLGYYDEWYKEYVQSIEQRDAVGYTDVSQMDAWVETRVFDARTQKMVWSGLSQTRIDGRDVRQISDAVGAILESMRKAGLY